MIDTASTHAVSFGLQAGLVQRSITYSKLTFDEQFNGDIYVPNSATGENFDDSKFIYPDVNAGVVWIKEVSNGFFLSSGVSFYHLNAPRQSFYSGEKVPLKRRIAAHLQSDIKINERTALLPSFLYMKQGSFSEFVLGGSVKYALSNKPGKEVALHLGAFGRMDDAFILHAGMDYNNWFGGFSYDMNTSGLKPASDGRGGPEFSLIYRIKKVKPLASHPPCPVY
jgi:type IX secretion system PorP/SprF family membrane protein